GRGGVEGAPCTVVGQSRTAAAPSPRAASSAPYSRTRRPQLVSVGIGPGICAPLERRRVELATRRAPGLRASARRLVESLVPRERRLDARRDDARALQRRGAHQTN